MRGTKTLSFKLLVKPMISNNQPEKLRLLLFLLAVLLGGTGLRAQTLNNDQQLWLGASVSGSLKKGWTLSSQVRVRITENVSTYKGTYIYLAANKRINKRNNVEANYRLALIREDTVLRSYHRFAAGYERSFRGAGLKFYLRPMVQYQRQASLADVEVSYKAKAYFRPRFTIKRELSDDWDIYIYAEPFFRLKRGLQTDWWQNSLGLKYAVKKNIKVNPYFIWQPDYTGKSFRTNFIYGLDLEFKLGKPGHDKDNPALVN